MTTNKNYRIHIAPASDVVIRAKDGDSAKNIASAILDSGKIDLELFLLEETNDEPTYNQDERM